MAIQLNDGNHESPMAEINVTPLVDVMLVLLVIFIIVAPVFSQSFRVDLPQVSAPSETDPIVMDLELSASGALSLNGATILLEALPMRLRAEIAQKPELVVRIGADRTTDYQFVAELLAKLKAEGITRLAFATQKPEP